MTVLLLLACTAFIPHLNAQDFSLIDAAFKKLEQDMPSDYSREDYGWAYIDNETSLGPTMDFSSSKTYMLVVVADGCSYCNLEMEFTKDGKVQHIDGAEVQYANNIGVISYMFSNEDDVYGYLAVYAESTTEYLAGYKLYSKYNF